MSVYSMKLDTEDPNSINDIIYILKHSDLFRDLELDEIRFTRSNFNHSDFRYTSFRRATLKGADLRGACFQGAMLEGANLRKAHLNGVKITPKQLSEIIIVDE